MNDTVPADEPAQQSPSGPNTWLNALIGAGVAVVFAFLPFSTVLGGAVAGYLQGGDLRAGATVGGLAGLMALVPIALVGMLIVGLLMIPAGLHGPPLVFGVFVVIGLFVLGTYTVGLGSLGGVTGAYINRDVDL
ncbi:MAG: DUF5518 domain-containing protein [Halobacteriales archaeon]|nr:DUF5518 domain-containing protein [Halobacteriales archaeon]